MDFILLICIKVHSNGLLTAQKRRRTIMFISKVTTIVGSNTMSRTVELGSEVLDDKSSAEIATAKGPLDYEAAVVRAI